MSPSHHTKHSLQRRYGRYLAVLQSVSDRSEWSVSAIKEACVGERPAFVTRVINELVQEGWLTREGNDLCRWNRGRGDFSATKWLDGRLYGRQLKSAPEQDRPRERLLAQGPQQLRTAELIAILIRSGRPGESALAAGEKIANRFDGRLDQLAAAGRGELKAISSAVEKTAYCQILAGIELGRRIAALAESQAPCKLRGADDAKLYCQRRFSRLITDAKQEEFHIVTLDTKNQVIDAHPITVGTLDASLVHPREVFRAAIKDAASSIILVHNHPSGDPTPSPEDHRVTERLTECGKMLGIQVLDHIVLGKGSAVSIRSRSES